MRDLIERQAAIDALGDEPEVWTGKDEYAQGLNNQWHYDRNAIKALPSAQPEQRWIPCSDGLPETPDEVLTTYIVNGNREKRYVETATWYEGDDGCWSSPWDEYRVMGTRVEVIAWMPLPEPYKTERRTDE